VPQPNIKGLKVSLMSQDSVEDFTFHGDCVSATIGSNNGPLCAPILEVVVTGHDSIDIKGAGISIEWQRIVTTESEVNVIRNGQPAVYKIVGKL
jgi:hypothetical protein